ncbi:MAG: NADH-quinone oxidoreductase subunit A [Verrucomicrobiota bacterium]|nr:NADH-quinone oxidoreductase subunit A [Verrucomicrobiota bacterium]
MLYEFFPIFVQAFVAIGFAVTALGLSIVLGQKGKETTAKNSPYECGMLAQGSNQPRFSVKFYLIAMLFILFDIEVVFMYPWSVVFRDLALAPAQVPADIFSKIFYATGGPVMWSMFSFLGILFIGYVYCLKKGAFDWSR